MIFVITTAGHGYTVNSLANREYGFKTPMFVSVGYDAMLRAKKVRRATYIFSDLERLSPGGLKLAAHLYQALVGHGLRCLNDPAHAMTRVELLITLHNAGLNPFQVWRADELPRSTRFPVFIRHESDHAVPLSGLISDQAQLDQALGSLRQRATPLRGLIVVGFCPAPYGPGLWHKWGTFRVGDAMSLDHIAVDDNWLVKYGDYDLLSDEVVRDEHDAVLTNRHAAELAGVFDLAKIEFGRADHATIGGRTVVYEINTNPFIGPFVPDSKPLRLESQRCARQRLAAAFEAIDTKDGGRVKIEMTGQLEEFRAKARGLLTRRR